MVRQVYYCCNSEVSSVQEIVLNSNLGSISTIFSSLVFIPPVSSGGRAQAHFPEQRLVIEPNSNFDLCKVFSICRFYFWSEFNKTA